MTVACTLTGADLESQQERWITLETTFGRGREETADGLRLLFVDHPAVERELRALVAAENDCCSWASWSVARHDGFLAMTARSKDEGVATLHGMFSRRR
jgi:hypothetical protein